MKEQAYHAPARKFGGTSLAISRDLVEMMQGRTWFESPWTDIAAARHVPCPRPAHPSADRAPINQFPGSPANSDP